MNNTKISVLIPAYNADKTIGRCIVSILNQQFTDFEIIVVNDGSTDNTANTVSDICERDVRVSLYSQNNKGVSAARNAALSIAEGKYIMFIDSDDYLDYHYLQSYYEIAESSAADVVVGGCIVNDLTRGVKTKKNIPITGDITRSIWAELVGDTSVFGYVWCKLIKKSLIESNNLCFDEKMYSQEDLEFMLSVYDYANKIIGINNTDYTYEYKISNRKPDFIGYIKNQLRVFEICSNKELLDSQMYLQIQKRLVDYSFTYLMYSKDRDSALSNIYKIPGLIKILRSVRVRNEKNYIGKLIADSHSKLVLFHFALRDAAKKILGRGA